MLDPEMIYTGSVGAARGGSLVAVQACPCGRCEGRVKALVAVGDDVLQLLHARGSSFVAVTHLLEQLAMLLWAVAHGVEVGCARGLWAESSGADRANYRADAAEVLTSHPHLMQFDDRVAWEAAHISHAEVTVGDGPVWKGSDLGC